MASEWPAWLWVDETTAYEYDPRGVWTLDDDPQNDFNAPTTQLYLHRDAARAWQAFRDFLDGTVEQWQKRVRNAVGIGASMGRALR